MTKTYTALANTTLSSTASSLTFSSIPTVGYRDLVIVFGGTASTSCQVTIEFNGDTGSNYFRQYMEYRGSVGAGQNADNRWMADVGTSTSNFIFQIMDYSTTDKHKISLVRSNDPSAIVWALAGRWANTSAITSVKLTTTTGSFAAGSTFSIYGIAS